MANPGLTKSHIAEAPIKGRRVVKFGAEDGFVVTASFGTDALIGLSDPLGQSAANARLDVILSGTGEAEAGAPFPRGALLTCDAQGRVIVAVPDPAQRVRTIGIALVSATNGGDIVDITIERGALTA